MISIKVLDKKGRTIAVSHGEQSAFLVASHIYEDGDRIEFEISEEKEFYVLQVDDCLGEELVYLTKNMAFRIPFGEKRICYSPRAFQGERHLLTARKARPEEVSGYRLLSRNRLDQSADTGAYPHASANIETRGEAVFAARNAIDGIYANTSHGEWPYGSWGINRDPNAIWKLEFGREVCIDKLIVYERADFPHDNWWKEVTVRFSDGSNIVLKLEKTEQGQPFSFEKKTVTWLQLENLIKSDEPSPFPALTQVEVFGWEENKDNLTL